MTFATYDSSYKPWTPSILLPEINDSITWDWYDAVSQFSQRLTKIATLIATVSPNEETLFDYSSLGCDYFPPILKAYYLNSGYWRQFDFFDTFMGGTLILSRTGNIGYMSRDYVQFKKIGLATCVFYNNINLEGQIWKLIAYM